MQDSEKDCNFGATKQKESMKKVHCLVFALAASAFVCFSCSVSKWTEGETLCHTNDQIVDTLFLTFQDMEDEVCEVQIKRNDVNFTGREVVTGAQVFFDIRSFPAGYYTAWIKIGGKFIRKTFTKL